MKIKLLLFGLILMLSNPVWAKGNNFPDDIWDLIDNHFRPILQREGVCHKTGPIYCDCSNEHLTSCATYKDGITYITYTGLKNYAAIQEMVNLLMERKINNVHLEFYARNGEGWLFFRKPNPPILSIYIKY